MAVTKARPVDPDLTFPMEIESSARPDDDTYSPANKKASGAEEAEDEAEDLEELSDGNSDSKPVTIHLKAASGNQINFLA